ncbi:hypothetical protein [Hyphococcus sp.]|uniref:hypothetical protein n=1 Tax=Hyphococcus sp. TaxID=2038636 RepID=UPI0035C74C69
MRIERRQDVARETRTIDDSLEEMAHAAIRSGPVCASNCARAGTCPCVRDCPHIPETLSSDPQNFPIEKGVAPLAFEIKKLGVFTPCWSCEGHNDADGAMRNAPAVWFYAHSVTHVRVLSDAVADMLYDKRLSSPWQVRLTFSDPGNLSAAFSLEPVAGAPDLSALQRDLAHLAEDIDWRVSSRIAALKRSIAP